MTFDSRTFAERMTPYYSVEKQSGGGEFCVRMRDAHITGLSRDQAAEVEKFLRIFRNRIVESTQATLRDALGIKN